MFLVQGSNYGIAEVRFKGQAEDRFSDLFKPRDKINNNSININY